MRRDGLRSIQRAARVLCRLIFIFSPVIARKFPNNAALLAALSAALVACEELERRATEQPSPRSLIYFVFVWLCVLYLVLFVEG